MATDPSIPLGYRPVQIHFQNLAELGQLRHQEQLTQLLMQQRQQEIERGQFDLDQRRRAMQDEEMLRQAYVDANGDLEKTGILLRQRGGSPKSLMALQEQQLSIRKTLAEIDDKELQAHKNRDEKLSAITYGALQLPDDQYNALWPQVRASAVSVDPKLDQMLPQEPLPKSDLQALALRFNTTTGLIAQETAARARKQEQRAAEKYPFELAELQSKTSEQQTKSRVARLNELSQRLALAMVKGKENYDAEVAALGDEGKPFRGLTTPQEVRDLGMTAQQQSQAELEGVGKIRPYPPPVQQQRLDLANAQAGAAAAARLALEQKDNAALVQAALADKTGDVYARMPKQKQDETAAELARLGFTAWPAKAPTGAQETVAAYAARIKQSNPVLENIVQGLGERIWNKLTPDFVNTEKGQVFAQAERNFINATLRRESGAVISPSEFVNARQQYIPQPGDSSAVLKQKRENRLVIQQSFIHAAGPAYVDPDQLLKEAGALPGNTPASTTPGATPTAAPANAGKQFLVKARDQNTYPFPSLEAAKGFIQKYGGTLVGQ